jgi:hypothetical protein
MMMQDKKFKQESIVNLEEIPEFKEGAEEFVEAMSECPACSIKLALELVDSDDPQDRKALKKILISLGQTLLNRENKPEFRLIDEERFPILAGLLSRGIILPRLAERLRID